MIDWFRRALDPQTNQLPTVEFDFSVQIFKGDMVKLLNNARRTHDWNDVLHNGMIHTGASSTA
jgi:hypothetical protein